MGVAKEMIFRTGDGRLLINGDPERELIRCRNCRHYTEQPGEWLCDLYEWVHEGDWFCADGDRLAGAEERPERRYCGYTSEDMHRVLDFLCSVEDGMQLDDRQERDFDVAIQCVATVLNRMQNDRTVVWD